MSRAGDEINVCDHCGVTFLWSLEEQRQSPPQSRPPLLCRGCAFLLPGQGRQRGLVKWYSPRRGYGFISPASGPDLFAHRSRFAGAARPRKDDLVEFAIEESERGPAAVDVRLLARAGQERTDPD